MIRQSHTITIFCRMMLRLETSLLLLVCLAVLFCSTEAKWKKGPGNPPGQGSSHPVFGQNVDSSGSDGSSSGGSSDGGTDVVVIDSGTDNADNYVHIGLSDTIAGSLFSVTLFICQI